MNILNSVVLKHSIILNNFTPLFPHMKIKRAFSSFLFFIIMISAQLVFSQANYADVRVDELSDAKIREMMQRAESVGYNDAQLEQMAAAQGMKPEEVAKLRTRVAKIRAGSGAPNDSKGNAVQSTARTSASGNIQGDSTIKVDVLADLRPKIFGSELFSKSNLSFEPNLRMATPRGYIIGPDDQLLIDLSGDNDVNYDLKVSPDGTIRLQYVGPVSVGGLSIEQATSKIRNSLASTYPSVRSGRTSIAVNLGNIRSIKVTILGEVIKPGSYTLSSLSSVFNALDASGGPNSNGSFRKIQVIRNNKVVSTVDVYDLLLNGIQRGNIRLQDQDVINIPVYQSRVEIAGEVKRPALFEVLAGENLADVIRFAGGFSNQAYTAQIKVLQNTNKERSITDVPAENFNTYGPLNGDKYVVEKILDRFANRVSITGAVFRGGEFELDNGLTLKGLISKAEGLTEDAFLNRGYINRLNADNTPSLISFDVAKVLAGTDPDITLQREDRVTISSLFDLRDEYKVSIQGEVRRPGTFNYGDNMSLEALIQMAGGFQEGATPNRIEISRRIRNSDALSTSAKTADLFTVNVDQNLKLESDTFKLQPFDIVSVRNSTGYVVQRQVKVEGEVLYPGVYTITSKDERLSDLVKRAGGLTPSAYTEGDLGRRQQIWKIRMRLITGKKKKENCST
jgi:protein involved in polysaccharide export with SLBB domain